MMLAEYKKWLAIGTGVGIEIGREDLQITVARVRPQGVSILGSLAIHHFRDQPAAEWGAVYSNFLRKLGQRHLAAQVLLPREALVVRQIQLPGVADKDLAAALKFQIDSQHPFQEDDVLYDFARIGKTATVLVGIGRRSVVDQYATLFSEAGVKISAFTFSAASLYSSVRMLSQPPAGGFLAFGETEDELEAYGESPARPVFSARLDASLERARTLGLSELRLPPDTEPFALTGVLPKPLAAPEDYDLTRGVFVYATAVTGACPWLSLSTNLLPPELRRNSSRLIYVPTIVLATLVIVMTVLLSAYSSFEDKRYLNRLQVEIQRIQPKAQMAATLDQKILVTRNRAQALDNFRRHLKDDMNAINDLSEILVPPAWLTSLQLTRDSISISGEAERAEALLKLLDNSKQFRRSEFTLPISRGGGGETFSLHSVREGVAP
jgi:Tfp pilus assembly protein PilN